MGKNRINHFNRSKEIEKFDPNSLIIPGHLNEDKLGIKTREGKVVVIFRDQFDGNEYVVDGRHATERARREGTLVDGVVLGEHDMAGRQRAIDRVLGMLLSQGKER